MREIARLAGIGRDYAFHTELFTKQACAWFGERPYNRIICGLSGGVDSAVAFRLAQQAYGDRVHGIFVDTGWMRAGETEEVRTIFGDEHVTYVDAANTFHEAIEAVPYPDSGSACEREYLYYKALRKTIGHTFIKTFENEAKRLGGAEALVQGTNAGDIIESQTGLTDHHNLELPDVLGVDVLEPLANLYKFEIRRLAVGLGLSEEVAYRQPFPGPGLTIRNWGKIDRSLAPLLQHGNQILEEVVKKHYPGYADRPCQYYVAPILLPSTGIMGDDRVVGYTWMVRMVAARTRESYASLDVFRPTDAFDNELVLRLTTETVHPDGSRFVNVLRNITPKPPSKTEPH
jgi:GMP synthase (glutamine-hydrolysing)